MAPIYYVKVSKWHFCIDKKVSFGKSAKLDSAEIRIIRTLRNASKPEKAQCLTIAIQNATEPVAFCFSVNHSMSTVTF